MIVSSVFRGGGKGELIHFLHALLSLVAETMLAFSVGGTGGGAALKYSARVGLKSTLTMYISSRGRIVVPVGGAIDC